jgi:hypothetical protein
MNHASRNVAMHPFQIAALWVYHFVSVKTRCQIFPPVRMTVETTNVATLAILLHGLLYTSEGLELKVFFRLSSLMLMSI